MSWTYREAREQCMKLYQGHTKAFLAREIELHVEKLRRGIIDRDDLFEAGRFAAIHELFRLLPCCAEQRSCLTLTRNYGTRICATNIVRFTPGREAWRSWAALGEHERRGRREAEGGES